MKNIPLSETEIKEIKDHYTQELERIQKRAHEITNIIQKLSTNSLKSEVVKNIDKKEPVVKAKKAIVAKKEVKPVAVKTEVSKPASLRKVVAPKKAVKAIKSVTAKSPKALTQKKAEKAKKEIVKKVSKVTAKPKKEIALKKVVKKSESKKAQYENYILDRLKKENKLVSSKEIFDGVEKQFAIKAPDFSKMKATVTVILSKTKINGAIKDYAKKGVKSKMYGLKEWFDTNGNIKDSYK